MQSVVLILDEVRHVSITIDLVRFPAQMIWEADAQALRMRGRRRQEKREGENGFVNDVHSPVDCLDYFSR